MQTAALAVVPRQRNRQSAPLGTKPIPSEALLIRLPQVARLLGGVSEMTAGKWLIEAGIQGRKLAGIDGRFYAVADVRGELEKSGFNLVAPSEEADDGSISR